MTQTIVVGAGLSGLACARELRRRDRDVIVVEAGREVGGRVRSDRVGSFTLDRGFQVFLTAYPEARRVLDYAALDLRPFFPGALVRHDDRFVRIADPFRRPLSAMRSAISPIGTTADKVRVLWLRRDALSGRAGSQPDVSTAAMLESYGFTGEMIDAFFRPFLGGVFLDSSLATSSAQLGFVWSMFAQGDTSLPAGGMQAIPQQLAQQLPRGTVVTGREARAVSRHRVDFVDGSYLEADEVVVAVDPGALERLVPTLPRPPMLATTCMYFAAPRSPIREPALVLNGGGPGPVNNLCVPSDVAPGYAPLDQALISTTILGDPGADDRQLEADVRRQMTGWFGAEVSEWEHLRTYRIPKALPEWSSGVPYGGRERFEGVWLCGDYTENPSINGALRAGRRVAEMICADGSAGGRVAADDQEALAG